MSTLANDNALVLQTLEKLERRAQRSRPVVAAAILLAVLSLIAATLLLVRSVRQAEKLEIAQEQLERALQERNTIAARLAEYNKVLSSESASPAAVEAARESSRALSQALPEADGGSFAMPSEVAVRRVQLLTVGAPTGWDLDVFWCDGAGAAENYATARAASIALAGPAAATRPIAPGVRLGRVQLRPIQPQQTAGWRAAMKGRNLLVVTDPGTAEAEAAQAIVGKILTSAAVIDQSELGASQSASRWYLSIGACAAG
ncbi:hypothetical protein E2493_13245 [Sphingomonas parva]|uniref:Uncharacterized protein n=1 Tax=Sphingomonas parva TaxID=2555898 RepID=A0A4Y8ZQP4_9SPHN|nr:hypothetical protein [Sphingomonas parva]TFI57787.1 hypothetical protein E2493_13245 [Sphingomonas parva]